MGQNLPPVVAIEMDRLKDIHCGLGQVCLHLGRALIAMPPTDLSLQYLTYPGDEKWFEQSESGALSQAKMPVKFSGLKKIYRGLPWMGPRTQLWHALHQDTRYLPPKKNIPFLLTINDLNFLREGDQSSQRINRRKKQLQRLIDRSQYLSCISEFTASEVRQHFNLGPRALQVVYLGTHLPEFLSPPPRPAFLPPAPYLFSVGTVLPKKNFHVIVPMLAEMRDLHWVCAGSLFGDYGQTILDLAKDFGVEARVHLTGKISEEQKYQALFYCQGLVHPSLAEGFGIPPLEAMNFGRPVFLSQECSLPEIGGKHAYYFSDFDGKNMAKVVSEGLNESLNNSHLAQLRRDHAKQFSWANTASAYLRIYRQLLGSV